MSDELAAVIALHEMLTGHTNYRGRGSGYACRCGDIQTGVHGPTYVELHAAHVAKAIVATQVTPSDAEDGAGHAQRDVWLRAVLAAHPRIPQLLRGIEKCGCGSSNIGQPGGYVTHVADALAPLLAAVEHDARVKAWREAADVCCTCHTADAPHEDWCVSTGILMMMEPEQ